MAFGTRSRRPVELALGLADGQVVDAGAAHSHQAVGIKLPVLVAVGAVPLPGIVAPLVSESHGDAVSGEGPQFLDQAVVEFLCPLAFEEGADRVASEQKLGTVAPLAVGRVG